MKVEDRSFGIDLVGAFEVGGDGPGVEGDVVDDTSLGSEVGGDGVVEVDRIGGGVTGAREMKVLGFDLAGIGES